METPNMNTLWVEDHGSVNSKSCTLKDNSTISDDRSVRVYFRDLEKHLTRHIREAPMVLGCVAWLTSEHILKALAQVRGGVALVVQKEDFLRPDLGATADWKSRLRASYDALRMIAWPRFL
jgi:hypothetical protein